MALALPEDPSLCKRLGGYDVIAGFTDQWLGLVLGDAARPSTPGAT
jgi:hypothetical protein